MKTHPTKCKFCGTPITVRIADDFDSPMLDSWIAMAACNFCADSLESRRRSEDRIWHFAKQICQAHRANLSKLEDDKPLYDAAMSKVKGRVSADLCKALKQYGERHAKFARKPFNCDSQEVQAMLFDHPDRVEAILRVFRGQIESQLV